MSYEPKPKVETNQTKTLNDDNIATSSRAETLNEPIDDGGVSKAVKNTKRVQDDVEDGRKTTNGSMKLGDSSSLSPRLSR